jgi:hypothetical protein
MVAEVSTCQSRETPRLEFAQRCHGAEDDTAQHVGSAYQRLGMSRLLNGQLDVKLTRLERRYPGSSSSPTRLHQPQVQITCQSDSFLLFKLLTATRDADVSESAFASGYQRAVSISHTNRVHPEASRPQVLCEAFINDCPASRYSSSTRKDYLRSARRAWKFEQQRWLTRIPPSLKNNLAANSSSSRVCVAETADPAVHTYKSNIAGSKDGRKHASGAYESLFRRVGYT